MRRLVGPFLFGLVVFASVRIGRLIGELDGYREGHADGLADAAARDEIREAAGRRVWGHPEPAAAPGPVEADR
jgi:hypothetical protein